MIFMDIRMPGINGIEAFLEIREILPECVVVIMSGYAVDPLIEEALTLGVRAVLQKPVVIDRSLGIVQEVLAG